MSTPTVTKTLEKTENQENTIPKFEDEKAYKSWKKSITMVLSNITSHKYAFKYYIENKYYLIVFTYLSDMQLFSCIQCEMKLHQVIEMLCIGQWTCLQLKKILKI